MVGYDPFTLSDTGVGGSFMRVLQGDLGLFSTGVVHRMLRRFFRDDGRGRARGRLEKRLRTVIEQSPLGIHVFSPDGRSLLANETWNEIWEVEEGEEPEGTNIFGDAQLRAAGLIPYIERGIAGETVNTPALLHDPARTGRQGRRRWLRALIYPVRDGSGSVSEVTLMLEDVTERRVLEERLSYLAFHDDLTGLPNRTLFVDRLEHVFARAGRREGKAVMLFMDLDNFKHVNDSLGHGAGDRLLVAVAGRLREVLRQEDTVARFGGDEFMVLLDEAGSSENATEVAGRIAQGLRAPFDLGEQEVFVTASIGIVLGDPGEKSIEDLLREVDIAMYAGKEGGKDRYEIFKPEMKERVRDRLGLESSLRRAVEREEFVVYYQPKVQLGTGNIDGMEALVRWRHPERGLVQPLEFIPLAEETGLIVPIGVWVLREACRQMKEWLERYPETAPRVVCVNLSPRQFRTPDLAEKISNILEEVALEPRNLELEVTESVLMEGAGSAGGLLRELKDLGVQLTIDDFGTGYSSLSRLKHLPVDSLKVDRSFVAGLGKDPGDEVLVSGIVDLANGLGLDVVAEGVETAEQLEWLLKTKCDSAQGYYFARPLDGESALELIRSQPLQK